MGRTLYENVSLPYSMLHVTRYLDALFYAIDGNYHQHQRKKPLDPNDFPMTMGAAYFANERDFRSYVTLRGEVEPEVRQSVCVRCRTTDR